MRIFNFSLLLLLYIAVLPVAAQVHLTEGFESGSKPTGWTEETVVGNEPWRYRNGGHSPNDNNWLVPPEEEDITRNPPAAYEGTYNAIFFKQGDNNERTKLITPELDVLGASGLELSFYLCQIPWTFEGVTGQDVLRIYYKNTPEGAWTLLHEYLDPVYDWEEQILVLPNPTATYYVAFEGHTRWGYGTCIDNVIIQETAAQSLYLGDVEFSQKIEGVVPSGSFDIPIVRIDMKVFGNTGSAILNQFSVQSLNTDDNDLASNGVKLYYTANQVFSTDHMLGSPTGFSGGMATFSGLSHSLPAGQSYLWVTYDIQPDAKHGNQLDVMVPAEAIVVNDSLYPNTDQYPVGFLTVYETLYEEDFEGSHGWTLTGEFEVGTPNGMGGSPGNPNPSGAFRGTSSLGTDLSGLGSNPYNYEPGLNEASSYTATSPETDVFYYKNLNIFFRRYLNIEVWDHAAIQVSSDGGTQWNTIWENTSFVSDFEWEEEKIEIPNEFARTEQFRIRYKLGPTDGYNNYSGWNVDDIYVTGEFISKDVGVSGWIYPQSGSGHTANDSVTVQIRNYGGADIVDPVLVAYSFDGGESWEVDQMNQQIPVGSSVVFTFPTLVDLSEPGFRPSVMAKTAMPGDQYPANDLFVTQLYIVPTYTPPYYEDFESNDGYWRPDGIQMWQHGVPAGNVINETASGAQSWMTGLNQDYGEMVTDPAVTIFSDDFEENLGWSTTGEFERASPSSLYIPYFAYSGYYCLGTDLTGQGASPYFYENSINEGNAHTAVSPPIDVSPYSDLRLSFASWITIQNGDSIRLEVSPDNGNSWEILWKNSEGEISDFDFEIKEFSIPEHLTNTQQFRIKFSLFHTSASGPVAEGWNIDNVLLLGDLTDLSPAYLTSPSFDLTGISEPVIETRLWVDTEEGMDGATYHYSLDDGQSWTPLSNTTSFDNYWNWYSGHPVAALGRDGWSGQTGDWIITRHLLPSNLLDKENVQFMVEFGMDKANNNYNGIAIDQVRIIEAPQDVDLLDILDPVSACELSPQQEFVLRMKNTGITALQKGDSIQVGYYIERNGEIQTGEETLLLDQPLAAGSTRDFNMSAQFDFGISGEYLTQVYLITEDPHYYKVPSGDTLARTILVNKPYVDLGDDISTVRPDTVLLRAYSGVSGQTYLWQDGSTDSLFHVSTDGTYHVTVTNGLGCQARDTIQVMQLIADVGIGSLVGPLSDCELGDQLPIEVTIQNFGTDTVEAGDTIYMTGEIDNGVPFGEAVVMDQRFTPGQSMSYTFPGSFNFSEPGAYQLKLYTRMSSDMVITNDTLDQLLEVYGYPDSDLGPDTVVVAADYLLAPGAGYQEYLWQDGSTGETFLVTEPGVDLYHVSIADEHQCSSSDSVIVTLQVMDLALEELLSPATSCELSESITISARFRNVGNQAIPSGESVQLGYRIDGGPVTLDQVTLAQNLLPGRSLDFTFSQSETVQTGQWYDFTVFVDYTNDSKSFNDTILQSVGVFETPALDLGGDQVVTELEYTLDAGSGFATYEWQDGSAEQTFTITQTGVGRYWVTVMDVNGCSVSDTVDIMLAVPDVGLLEIDHPVTTCHLEDTEHVTVAVQNSGNWDIEPGAAINVAYSINGAEVVVEPLELNGTFEPGTILHHTFFQEEDFSEPGRYEIVAYTEYASDLVPTNDIVLVNVDHFGSPTVDIGMGQDTIVVYEPITLSATQGYPSYLWQDGSTDTIYQINDPSQGMYSVAVTGDNGCVTVDSVYVAYDVPDLKVTRLMSPLSSCELEGTSEVSIEIANNGYFRIGTEDTLIISYSVDGVSSVIEEIQLERELLQGDSTTVTFMTGHDFTSLKSYLIKFSLLWSLDENLSNNLLSSTVNVWGYPHVEIEGAEDSILGDLPVTLTASGSGIAAYLWQDLSAGPSHEATAPGHYWVLATDIHGCADTDSVYVDWATSARAPGDLPGQVYIYPNPAGEVLHVALDFEVEKEVRVELYNIANSLIYREDIKSSAVRETQIDVQDLIPGTYLLRITVDQVPHHFKVIVE